MVTACLAGPPRMTSMKDMHIVPHMYCGTKTVAGNNEWDAYEDIMYIIRNIYPKLCEYGECHY